MLRQSSYLFAAKVLGFGIRILLPVFLVRTMTKADIGAYNQFFLVETLMRTVFQLGVSQSLFFFVPRDKDNAGGYFLNSLLLNVALIFAGYGFFSFFRQPASEFLGIPILTLYFREIVIYGILLMLNVTAITYVTASKKFKQAAIFEILMQVLASIATLTAAFLTRDLHTILTWLVVSRGFSFLLIMAFIHFKLNSFNSERYFFDVRKQIKYGATLGLGGMLGTVMMRMHEVSVSKLYDIETYAVYAQGLKQIPILQFYTQSIAAVALVQFAHLVKKDDWAGVQAFWNKILASVYGIGIPATLFLVLIAQPLIIALYTQDYAQAVPIFQINSLGMLFFLLNPGLILRALDRNDVTIKVNLGVLLVLPVLLYWGMTAFGLIGIIGAHALVLIFSRAIPLFFLNRMVPVHLAYFPPRELIWDFYRNSTLHIIGKMKALHFRRP